MKKMLMLIIALMLPLTVLAEGPLPEELLIPGQEAVTMADAAGIAFGLPDAPQGEHTTRLQLVRLTDNTHAWVATTFGEDAWHTVTLSAEDGETLWQETSSGGVFRDTLAAWEQARGDAKDWSGETFRLYDRLYAPAADTPAAEAGIDQAEAERIAMAAAGVEDESLYQRISVFTGDLWQVFLVQEGQTMWQVDVDAAGGQVRLMKPSGAGNG
ncbi:MAG: hypothetical protein IJ507_10435 [Clostridia bacterium]|nr:hypothetical protein [Clostridia bacterium]